MDCSRGQLSVLLFFHTLQGAFIHSHGIAFSSNNLPSEFQTIFSTGDIHLDNVRTPEILNPTTRIYSSSFPHKTATGPYLLCLYRGSQLFCDLELSLLWLLPSAYLLFPSYQNHRASTWTLLKTHSREAQERDRSKSRESLQVPRQASKRALIPIMVDNYVCLLPSSLFCIRTA